MRVCDLLVIALVVAATFKPLPIQAKTSKWAEGEFRKAVDVVAAQKGIAAHTIKSVQRPPGDAESDTLLPHHYLIKHESGDTIVYVQDVVAALRQIAASGVVCPSKESEDSNIMEEDFLMPNADDGDRRAIPTPAKPKTPQRDFFFNGSLNGTLTSGCLMNDKMYACCWTTTLGDGVKGAFAMLIIFVVALTYTAGGWGERGLKRQSWLLGIFQLCCGCCGTWCDRLSIYRFRLQCADAAAADALEDFDYYSRRVERDVKTDKDMAAYIGKAVGFNHDLPNSRTVEMAARAHAKNLDDKRNSVLKEHGLDVELESNDFSKIDVDPAVLTEDVKRTNKMDEDREQALLDRAERQSEMRDKIVREVLKNIEKNRK